MPKFLVEKELVLEVVVEAATPQEAIDKMLNMDDGDFALSHCDYNVFHWESGDRIDEDDWEKPYGS